MKSLLIFSAIAAAANILKHESLVKKHVSNSHLKKAVVGSNVLLKDLACQAGYYGNSNGCKICSTGKYSTADGDSGASKCEKCPAGTYSASPSDSCPSCPAGTASSKVGATSCDTTCAAGSYSAAGATECSKCAAGSYSSYAGSDSCTFCAANTYGSTTGLSKCTSCPLASTSAAGSTTCVCKSGYTMKSNKCYALTSDAFGSSVAVSVLATLGFLFMQL